MWNLPQDPSRKIPEIRRKTPRFPTPCTGLKKINKERKEKRKRTKKKKEKKEIFNFKISKTKVKTINS